MHIATYSGRSKKSTYEMTLNDPLHRVYNKHWGGGDSINARHERFAREYIIDRNATQAAIRAGYTTKTAGQQGFRLLKNAEIQAAIADAEAERRERVGINADRVLLELAKIGFADIADYVDAAGASVAVKELDQISDDKRGAIASIKSTRDGVEVKLADKLRALELIGKHIGMFRGDTDASSDDDDDTGVVILSPVDESKPSEDGMASDTA